MRVSRMMIGLLGLLVTSGICPTLAGDSSLEYRRVTSVELKWSPLHSMPRGHRRLCSMVIRASLASTPFDSESRRIPNCPCTLTLMNAFAL